MQPDYLKHATSFKEFINRLVLLFEQKICFKR